MVMTRGFAGMAASLSPFGTRTFARTQAMNSSSVMSPAASRSIAIVASTSGGSNSAPFSARNMNSAAKPVRLFPSTNGWLRTMPIA